MSSDRKQAEMYRFHVNRIAILPISSEPNCHRFVESLECYLCALQPVAWGLYTGPIYAAEEFLDCICLWCIANSTAHTKLDASFTNKDAIGSYSDWEAVCFRKYCRSSLLSHSWLQWLATRTVVDTLERCCTVYWIRRCTKLAKFGPQAMLAIRINAGLAE